jgi:hypothetical protein
MDDRGSIPVRGKVFLLSTASKPAVGPTEPPIQWTPEALSLGIKQPGGEAGHSPCNAEVKNGAAIPPLLHMSLWHSG